MEMRKEISPVRVMGPTSKRVEVVYYLSRNGQLEHPHYMELTLLPHHHLQLKDFMNRLTVLRGKGMPSLYSWSCKRIYKNGYVWNDLAENDVIFPSEGDEYVLKGSELVLGCTGKNLIGKSEKLNNHLQGSNNAATQMMSQDQNFQSKRRFLATKRRTKNQQFLKNDNTEEKEEEQEQEQEQEQEEYEEKTVYTRCSRGVSTDEIEEEFKQQGIITEQKNTPTELIIDPNCFSISPPSTTSSTHSDNSHDKTAKRFEDGDPQGTEPMLSRNSMLFSLIACGGLGSFRKTVPPVAKESPSPPPPARKSGSLHLQVVCKAAAAAKVVAEEEDMISYMPENPRFGGLQSEEKEYFSGSIVESIATEERIIAEPGLKKSSSYKQEKSAKSEFGDAPEEEESMGVKGKCIPRKKSSLSSSRQLFRK